MSQQTGAGEEQSGLIQFNTKPLMISSAVFMGFLGIMGSFLPQEITGYIGASVTFQGTLLIKVAGALYFGFAVLNWMARHKLIGGIYSRPVALGNFAHFVIVAIMLLKSLITNTVTLPFIIASVIYTIFAISFGYILFAGGKSCS